MIGQHKLLNDMKTLHDNNSLPRFCLFIGPKGSGKKLLVKEVISMYPDYMVYTVPDIKIDNIRDMIAEAYKTRVPTFYIIPDADNMSVAAKNAMLKITEEPPNNAKFLMTLEDKNNTLDTIRSRAIIFYMDRYTPQEIYEYGKQFTNYTLHDDEWDIIKNICDTPGEVDKIGKYPREFYDYVELVLDNMAEVSGANAFKIGNKVAIKDGVDGYDLKLFWKAFCSVCMDRLSDSDKEDVLRYSAGVRITSNYLSQLRIKGINRQMLFDTWLLDIRREWM